MTINDAVSMANSVTGQETDTALLVRWLSELDGQIAFKLYRDETFEPYDPADLTTELLVPFPHDGIYRHHLEAMVYFANGEYDRYENARQMREKKLADFRSWMQRTKSRPCQPGFPRS